MTSCYISSVGGAIVAPTSTPPPSKAPSPPAAQVAIIQAEPVRTCGLSRRRARKNLTTWKWAPRPISAWEMGGAGATWLHFTHHQSMRFSYLSRGLLALRSRTLNIHHTNKQRQNDT